jgi:hypothetical protein
MHAKQFQVCSLLFKGSSSTRYFLVFGHVNTILTLDIMTRLITDDTGDQSLPHYYHIIIEKNSINNGTK